MDRVVTGNAGKTEQTMEVDVRLAFFVPYMGQDDKDFEKSTFVLPFFIHYNIAKGSKVYELS